MKRYQAIYPYILITAGLVVRCWNLTALPAWYDEAYTLLVARLPLARLLQAVAGDVHPPLYYLIISGLVHAMPLDQLFALRLFSVVCSLAGLVVAWRISGLLSVGKSTRLVALALLAFHPVMIYYSQEGRMYAWLTLLVLLQCWALLRGKWWLLGLATLACLSTHNYGMFYTAILGVVGLGYFVLQPIPVYRAGKDSVLSGPIGKFLLSMGIPVGLFLPWLWALSRQMGQISTAGYWLPDITPGSVIMTLYRVIIGSNVPDRWNIVALPLTAAGLLLCFVATRRWLGLWALVVGPVDLALVVSAVWKPILLYRGLIPSLPFLAMAAGMAFTQATGPGRIGRWLLLAPLVMGLGGVVAYPYIYDSKTDVIWPETVGEIPALVHMEDTSYITISATYPNIINYFLDAGCPEQPGGMSAATRQALGYKIITPNQLPEHYYLAAVISTLSTQCHEATFHRLTDDQQAILRVENPYGIYGIWER